MPELAKDNGWIIAASKTIEKAILDTSERFYPLIIIIGAGSPPRSIFLKILQTRVKNAVYINLGLEVSRILRNIPACNRKDDIETIVRNVSENTKGDVLLFDGLDVLLDPDLEFDPIRFLRGISRKHKVVAAIDGEYVKGILTYAKQGHLEHRRMDVEDLAVIDLRRICY